MESQCKHPVGEIASVLVLASDWNASVLKFAAVVEDFNIRGQRDQIEHPGWAIEFKFCPLCSHPIDRTGLLTLAEARAQYQRKQQELTARGPRTVQIEKRGISAWSYTGAIETWKTQAEAHQSAVAAGHKVER